MSGKNLDTIKRPELFIAIAGPIGVQTDRIIQSLEVALEAVKYSCKYIKLSAEMMAFEIDGVSSSETESDSDYYSQAMFKMDYATALCRQQGNPATLAAIAIRSIQHARNGLRGGPERPVPEGIAYLVSQLKRPDEVDLLRRVYGKQFILVSAHGSNTSRLSWIIEQIKRQLSAERTTNEIEKLAKDLMDRDAEEAGDPYGQHLRDTFHMADVFVDGMDASRTRFTVDRFIQAFFGRTDIAPSKGEYGMYVAKSASLRSTDLSRQVGAAIFSADGEIIAQGCNEVPKAFGGTYWDLETPDHRDVKIGYDPNEKLRNELLRDLFQRLKQHGYLSSDVVGEKPIAEVVKLATEKNRSGSSKPGPLDGALIMDLTEYGRVVHAEMCAICDAARLGKALKGSVLYCTTFPCHNCAKHILAAGISCVYYIEPYAKSRVKDLHENEIVIDEQSKKEVSFQPFLGISPMRYRDIFQKGRRKNSQGIATYWVNNEPIPMIEIVYTSYIQNELYAQAQMVVDIQPTKPLAAITSPIFD